MKKHCALKRIASVVLSTLVFFYCSIPVHANRPSNSNSCLPSNITTYGGSFDAIRSQTYDHKKFEVHHLISRSALNLFAKYTFNTMGKSSQNDFLSDNMHGWAPAILLSKEDHLKTLSSSTTGHDFSMLYISGQATHIIQYGAFLETLKNEIAYIQKYINLDGKYDEGIRQVCNYIRSMNIRIYKNKLSFYPLGAERKGLKFIYTIPRHGIFEEFHRPDSYIDESHILVDSATQT